MPTHLVSHLHFFQSHNLTQKMQKSHQTITQDDRHIKGRKRAAANSGLA